MPFPGVNISFGNAAPAAGPSTDTGQGFMVGLAQKGPVGTATKITSLSGFTTTYGVRQSDSVLYDSVEAAFREGASAIYISRAVGPAPTLATVALTGAAAAASIQVNAENQGIWGASLNVAVLAGTTSGVRIQISHDTDGILETSGDLTTVTEIVTWSQNSDYVNITANGTVLPSVIAAQSLVGGTDDRASITNSQWTAALTSFPANLGPGQVSTPGQSNSTIISGGLIHAAATGRVYLADTPNSTTFSDLTTAASAMNSDANAEYGAMFGPWVSIPGIVPSTTRTVPMSAIMTGLIAKSDRYFNAGRAVAGYEFRMQYGVNFTQFTDAQFETATLTGLNLARREGGVLMPWGFRSLVDADTDPEMVGFNVARLRMAIGARLNSVAQKFVFSQLDGQGHTILQFKDALSGVLSDFYIQGALYGDLADDTNLPFRVDVGADVNTPETLSERQLNANVGLRMSPFAELIYISVNNIPITQSV